MKSQPCHAACASHASLLDSAEWSAPTLTPKPWERACLLLCHGKFEHLQLCMDRSTRVGDGGACAPVNFSRQHWTRWWLSGNYKPSNNMCMQGVRFTAALVEGGAYLLAANGPELFATSLKLQSIHVENALAAHGAGTVAAQATSATNRLLNYVHSCCLRFPLDDCIGLAEASLLAQQGQVTTCRTVRLHIATGARFTVSWCELY